MTQHYRENEGTLFPTYLITGRYLPSIKSLDLTPMPSATQANAGENTKADAMEVDKQESDDRDRTPKVETSVKEEMANEGAVRDEEIQTRGMLLVGGRAEMEGGFFIPAQ